MSRRRSDALEVVACYPGQALGGTPLWRYLLPYGPLLNPTRVDAGSVHARTRSEARAAVKRQLNLARLPVASVLYRIH